MIETKTEYFRRPGDDAQAWINRYEALGWSVSQIVPLLFGPSSMRRTELMVVLERPKHNEA